MLRSSAPMPAPDPLPALQPVRREARALAAALDLVVVALLGAVCAMASLTAMLLQVNPLERDPTGGEWAVGYALLLCWIPIASLYAAMGSRTIGARLLRLRIDRETLPRRIVRGLMWWISLVLVGAGLWWPWVDARGRSLADIASRSRTLEASES